MLPRTEPCDGSIPASLSSVTVIPRSWSYGTPSGDAIDWMSGITSPPIVARGQHRSRCEKGWPIGQANWQNRTSHVAGATATAAEGSAGQRVHDDSKDSRLILPVN